MNIFDKHERYYEKLKEEDEKQRRERYKNEAILIESDSNKSESIANINLVQEKAGNKE